VATGTHGIYGLPFDKEPASQTQESSALAAASSATDRALLAKVFSASAARWYGHHNTDVQGDVAHRVTDAASRHAIATLVVYNIPHLGCRDTTGVTASGYRQWIDRFTLGLGTHRAVVVVEPDALPELTCLTSAQQTERLGLLSYAVKSITSQGSWAYLDAGHSKWVSASTMATRLRSAGVGDATGFSLNVSNFRSNAETIPYGQAISKLIGGAHFVVDTGRNGLNPDSTESCNPPNRGLGMRPTTSTAAPQVDAYLWVKTPGRSDGSCNGGNYAGAWLQSYALMLARNAAF
jgi:endoglucanase